MGEPDGKGALLLGACWHRAIAGWGARFTLTLGLAIPTISRFFVPPPHPSTPAVATVRKVSKIVVLVTAAVLMVGGLSLVAIYKAAQQVPQFYREAIALDPLEQQTARDEFVAQVTALASDLHRSGHWQSLFSAEQINAWLALELTANYPDLLRGGLHDPRVSIHAVKKEKRRSL